MATQLAPLLVFGGLLLWAARRKPLPENGGAEVTIEIIPGHPISRGIAGIEPTIVTEGTSGNIAKVTVTNTSYKQAGTTVIPWEAYLGTRCIVAVGGSQLLDEAKLVTRYNPGGTLWYDFSFTVPWGSFGVATATAFVYDPDGNVLSTASVDFTIYEVAIVYGADVIF